MPSPHTILIVSPSAELAPQLLGALSRMRYFVGLCTDINQLAKPDELPLAAQPGVILLDDSMGFSAMLNLVAHLRKQLTLGESHILPFGTFNEEQEVTLFKNGANDVLAKPLRLNALAYRLSRYMKA